MFEPQKLKFDKGALKPFLNEENVTLHYDKHTKGYFKKTNELIKGTHYENIKSLEELVRRAFKDGSTQGALFKQCAQAWNHDFYWSGITPKDSSGKPSDKLLKQFTQDFKDFDDFKKQFNDKAVGQFGSGWCWLVINKIGKLEIDTTANALTPIVTDKIPLLVIDVWEHAYYPTYFNERATYVENFWNIVNWEFVNDNFNKNTK